ncbi:MAG: hypothetical protein GY880_02895 [Planctomycetaceae bacterium]|nr:hypothetical protein [Planctomycetaceae bacterium]
MRCIQSNDANSEPLLRFWRGLFGHRLCVIDVQEYDRSKEQEHPCECRTAKKGHGSWVEAELALFQHGGTGQGESSRGRLTRKG